MTTLELVGVTLATVVLMLVFVRLDKNKRKLNRIMITQQELAAGLKTIQTQVGKVATEQSTRFDALSKEIADLKAVIDQGGTIGPEVETAFKDVQTALNDLDATIPDAPTA